MTTDNFRQLLRRHPFEPFKIHLSDGRAFDVVHRDFLLLPRDRNTSIVFALPGGQFEWIYLKQVTSISSTGDIPSTEGRSGASESEQ